ncbi:MAG: class II aldolase/adducin family protein [Acetobacteraceae bacterium]|nr:class II aldolase/adducin family protein [Acetobacteraceae bacterium]
MNCSTGRIPARVCSWHEPTGSLVKTDKVAAARERVAVLYRELGRLGMCSASSGNVSVRATPLMLMTASGVAAEDATADAVAAISLDGAVQGDVRPSSEWHLHAGIYQKFPAARCVVHTHSDAATALSCLNEGLPAFHYMIAGFGGAIRCAPYVTFGTQELADAAVAAIAGRSACLLANHGMVVFGRDEPHALSQAVLLETLCRQYLLARSAGVVRILSAVEMRAARARFRNYGGRRSRG